MKQRLPRTQTSLFKTCAQRKAGRRQRARRFACRLYPSHGPLRFITSHSFRARLCHAKNEAPEEEAEATRLRQFYHVTKFPFTYRLLFIKIYASSIHRNCFKLFLSVHFSFCKSLNNLNLTFAVWNRIAPYYC